MNPGGRFEANSADEWPMALQFETFVSPRFVIDQLT